MADAAALVHVVVCGAVDDGKSTLLGRLLFETASVTSDELEAAQRASLHSTALMGDERLDYSLLVDGLESEREQGITIDVAHRQLRLSTGTRVLLADSPGHEQYTRNMAVASSTADIAVLVVDAVRGVRQQTLRHAAVCRLMGVSRIIVAVNKLDAVANPAETFDRIRDELEVGIRSSHRAARPDGVAPVVDVIAVSGLRGDNVTTASRTLPVSHYSTLLQALEVASAELTIRTSDDAQLRMPVQLVLRDDTSRRYAGRLSGASLSVGDEVAVWPSGSTATVLSILAPESVETAGAGLSISIALDRELDIGRGDVIVRAAEFDSAPASRAHLAEVVWMASEPLDPSNSYLLVSGPLTVPARVDDVRFVLDLDSGEQLQGRSLVANDIARIEVTADREILLDNYELNRDTGGFLLVDRASGTTVAAGMAIHPVRRESDVQRHAFSVDRAAREQLNGVRGAVFWLTGLPGSGKSSIADELEKRLLSRGIRSFVLDGDTVRQTLSEDLGFSPQDRAENVRRVARTAQLMLDAGLIVIVSLVSPFRADRGLAKEMFATTDFYEVYVDTPLDVCIERDPKGLYAKAAETGDGQMTGAGQVYEEPLAPALHLNGTHPVAESVRQLLVIISDRRFA